jgi:hypothetical protein
MPAIEHESFKNERISSPDGKMPIRAMDSVAFDLGQKSYGKFGSLHIKGEIPLIGTYHSPKMENALETENFFLEKLGELRIPWKDGENLRATGAAGWIRTAITACAYGIPSVDISSNRMRGFICFNLGKNMR